jgi:transposase
VVTQVVPAVDAVRRREARTDAAARAELARTSWLWRKNPETWTVREDARWEQLKDRPLVTGLAYAMRLALQGAYAATTAAAARSRFTAWIRWVRTEATELKSGLLEPMRAVADMVERHLEGILAHWQQGLTTAFLEGLNSLFSAVKRKARGYRTKEYQITMLYFVAGKLEIPYYA